MENQIEEIRNQIAEIQVDPQGRRAYPESLKAHVRKLVAQGMSLQEVAAATGIHVTTLHYWCPRPKKSQSKFKEVKVTHREEEFSKVEIHFASGAKIVGLSVAQLTELLRQELVR